MTPVSGPHLTPDDLDAWLAGALAPAAQDHLAGCPACRERAETEREIVALLGGAAADEPRARVRRSGHGAGRRARAGRRAHARPAPAPGLRHPPLAGHRRQPAGARRRARWPAASSGPSAIRRPWPRSAAGSRRRPARPRGSGVRGVASNFIEQPWFAGLRALAAQSGPPRARLRARARSPIWAASWRSAASWLCRRSRWPMRASSRLPRGAGAARRCSPRAPPSPAPGSIRPAPARSSWSTASGRSSPTSPPARRRRRHPDAPSRAPGHPPGSERRAAGRASTT